MKARTDAQVSRKHTCALCADSRGVGSSATDLEHCPLQLQNHELGGAQRRDHLVLGLLRGLLRMQRACGHLHEALVRGHARLQPQRLQVLQLGQGLCRGPGQRVLLALKVALGQREVQVLQLGQLPRGRQHALHHGQPVHLRQQGGQAAVRVRVTVAER